LDGAFLGRLAALRRYRHAHDLEVSRIVVQSPSIKRIFDAAGFSKLWPICATLDQALYSFGLPVPA
jgi:hypothetical protein